MVNPKKLLYWLILSILFSYTFLSAQEKRFIAILPFTNQASAEYAWVARGIEEILYEKFNKLSAIEVFEKVTLVRILADNDIQSGKDLTVRKAFAVGKETGVDVLVAGSYRTVGTNLQLNFRIVSTYTGRDIFQQRFEGNLQQIFKLHEDAIRRIMSAMNLSLRGNENDMLATSSTSSMQAFEDYCKAYIQFERGAPMQEVASLFTRALQKDPDFWEAQYNLGVIYYNFNRYDKALQQFNQVIDRNPSFYKPYYGMGVIFYLQRRYTQAIRNFEKVLEINADHDRSLFYLGRVYIRLDSIEKSLNFLEKSAEINPNYAPTQYYIGLANMNRGWYKTAVQAFKKSLKLDPSNYRAHNGLGMCYYRLQHFDVAIFEYQKAIKLRDDYSTAYFNLGNTIYKRGALEEIVSAYLEILETRYTNTESGDEGSGIYEEIKKLRTQHSGESEEVYNSMIEAYRNALEYEPSFFEAAFNLALTYENIGNADSAEYFYKKAIESKPNLVRAHMRLGRLYEAQERYDEALEHFKEVVKIEPSYFADTPRLGEDYRYINIIEEVLQQYQTKLERKPNDPGTLLVLARIYNSLGRFGQAREYYRQTVQIDPDNREANRELKHLRRERKEL